MCGYTQAVTRTQLLKKNYTSLLVGLLLVEHFNVHPLGRTDL